MFNINGSCYGWVNGEKGTKKTKKSTNAIWWHASWKGTKLELNTGDEYQTLNNVYNLIYMAKKHFSIELVIWSAFALAFDKLFPFSILWDNAFNGNGQHSCVCCVHNDNLFITKEFSWNDSLADHPAKHNASGKIHSINSLFVLADWTERNEYIYVTNHSTSNHF